MNIFQSIIDIIAIDLSKKVELENPDLKRKKKAETTFAFSQNYVTVCCYV